MLFYYNLESCRHTSRFTYFNMFDSLAIPNMDWTFVFQLRCHNLWHLKLCKVTALTFELDSAAALTGTGTGPDPEVGSSNISPASYRLPATTPGLSPTLAFSNNESETNFEAHFEQCTATMNTMVLLSRSQMLELWLFINLSTHFYAPEAAWGHRAPAKRLRQEWFMSA